VVSRSTRTGTCRLGASSWMPPESVRIRAARAQQIDQRAVIHRRQQGDARHAGQRCVYRPPDARVAMHRVDDVHPPIQANAHLAQRPADGCPIASDELAQHVGRAQRARFARSALSVII
jgi:hypothetical protein